MRGEVELLFPLQLRFIEEDSVGNVGDSRGVCVVPKGDSFNRFMSSLGAFTDILRSVYTTDPVHIPLPSFSSPKALP